MIFLHSCTEKTNPEKFLTICETSQAFTTASTANSMATLAEAVSDIVQASNLEELTFRRLRRILVERHGDRFGDPEERSTEIRRHTVEALSSLSSQQLAKAVGDIVRASDPAKLTFGRLKQILVERHGDRFGDPRERSSEIRQYVCEALPPLHPSRPKVPVDISFLLPTDILVTSKPNPATNDTKKRKMKKGGKKRGVIRGAKKTEVKRGAKKKDAKKKKKKKAGGKKTTGLKSKSKPKPKSKPKRPPSAFLIFSNKKRPEVKAQFPYASFADVARTLGSMWTKLSNEEKRSYAPPPHIPHVQSA